jgi:hypothetical protein
LLKRQVSFLSYRDNAVFFYRKRGFIFLLRTWVSFLEGQGILFLSVFEKEGFLSTEKGISINEKNLSPS